MTNEHYFIKKIERICVEIDAYFFSEACELMENKKELESVDDYQRLLRKIEELEEKILNSELNDQIEEFQKEIDHERNIQYKGEIKAIVNSIALHWYSLNGELGSYSKILSKAGSLLTDNKYDDELLGEKNEEIRKLRVEHENKCKNLDREIRNLRNEVREWREKLDQEKREQQNNNTQHNNDRLGWERDTGQKNATIARLEEKSRNDDNRIQQKDNEIGRLQKWNKNSRKSIIQFKNKRGKKKQRTTSKRWRNWTLEKMSWIIKRGVTNWENTLKIWKVRSIC